MFTKTQIQLTIEALLMARSAGAHAIVLITDDSGVEHKFDGIVSDGSIDNLVDDLEAKGTGYDISLTATGRPYSRSEDRSIEQTINALSDTLGQIEEEENAEIEKMAAIEAPKVIEEIYKYLTDGKSTK